MLRMIKVLDKKFEDNFARNDRGVYMCEALTSLIEEGRKP